MDPLRIVDELDDLIHNAKAVPLTDTVRVDKEQVYDLLDQLRATLPEEIKAARAIVQPSSDPEAIALRELLDAHPNAVPVTRMFAIAALVDAGLAERVDGGATATRAAVRASELLGRPAGTARSDA